jgi:hypothetical protein
MLSLSVTDTMRRKSHRKHHHQHVSFSLSSTIPREKKEKLHDYSLTISIHLYIIENKSIYEYGSMMSAF